MLAYAVSGGLRGSWAQIADHALGNLADYVLLALFAGLALARTRSVRDLLFYAFCAVSGFLIINQNFQAWGILTIHAAAAVAAETILRAERDAPEAQPGRQWSVASGAKLLFLALVLPSIVHSTIAFGLHAGTASLRAGEAIPLPNLDRVRLANLWTWGDHGASLRYLERIRDGASALASLSPAPTRVMALDHANPFSAGLGTEPPRGDSARLLWGRTLDETHFIPAGRLLADVQVVMEPKPFAADDPGDAQKNEKLRALYASGLAEGFTPARETDYWTLHLRREPNARTSGSGPAPGGTSAALGAAPR